MWSFLLFGVLDFCREFMLGIIKNISFRILKTKIVFGIFFNLSLFQVFSQNNHFDTVIYSLNTSPQFLFKVDSKFSFVSNQLVSMRGVKAGLNYNDIVKLGLGYSWMKNGFVFDNPTEVINNDNYELHYSALIIFADYVFRQNKSWSLVYNIDIGGVRATYKNTLNDRNDYKSYGVIFAPTLISEHRFFSYFIIGVGGGYRAIFRNRGQVLEKFSAPIFIVRAKIDFVLLYNSFVK